MPQASIDQFAIAHGLEEAGFNAVQAEAMVRAMNVISGSSEQIASDVAKLKQDVACLPELKQDVAQLKQDVACLPELKQDVAQLKQDVACLPQLKRDVAQLKRDVAQLKRDVACLPELKQDVAELKRDVACLPAMKQDLAQLKNDAKNFVTREELQRALRRQSVGLYAVVGAGYAFTVGTIFAMLQFMLP